MSSLSGEHAESCFDRHRPLTCQIRLRPRPPDCMVFFDMVPHDVLVCVVELLGRLELEMFKCTCRSARAAVRQVERMALRRPVRLCDLAAKGGHLQLLQWLQQQSCPIDQATRAAAHAGQLHVLEWMARADVMPILRLGDVMIEATSQGHVHVLDWLTSAFQPGDLRTTHTTGTTLEVISSADWCAAFERAAYNGHVHVLWWAHRRNYNRGAGGGVGFWKNLRRDAISSGNWHAVCWIDTVKPMCRKPLPGPLCYAAVLAIAMVYTGGLWLMAEVWHMCPRGIVTASGGVPEVSEL